MRRWDVPKGASVCREGAPGGSCFIVVEGVVEVSIVVRGERQMLARLLPGSIFGQVSLVTGAPRNATCSAPQGAVVVEIKRPQCERLLNEGSRLALKFLATLNQGLISALRGADRRLMRLKTEDRVSAEMGADNVALLVAPPPGPVAGAGAKG